MRCPEDKRPRVFQASRCVKAKGHVVYLRKLQYSVMMDG